MVYYDILQFY